VIDDLLHLAQAIPLWANIIIAVGLFAGLRVYAGEQAPVFPTVPPAQIGQAFIDYLPKLLGYCGQYALPPIFIIGGLLGSLQRKVQSKKFARIAGAVDPGNAIRSLSWYEFERMVGEALRRQGYTVAETKKGPDGGVDLVLRKDGERFLVQCKQWRAFKVSVQVVRELYGVMAAQGATGGFVVTSGAFTAEARRFACGTSIQLIDGQRLTRWFRPEGDI
jgi:restriction system protein